MEPAMDLSQLDEWRTYNPDWTGYVAPDTNMCSAEVVCEDDIEDNILYSDRQGLLDKFRTWNEQHITVEASEHHHGMPLPEEPPASALLFALEGQSGAYHRGLQDCFLTNGPPKASTLVDGWDKQRVRAMLPLCIAYHAAPYFVVVARTTVYTLRRYHPTEETDSGEALDKSGSDVEMVASKTRFSISQTFELDGTPRATWPFCRGVEILSQERMEDIMCISDDMENVCEDLPEQLGDSIPYRHTNFKFVERQEACALLLIACSPVFCKDPGCRCDDIIGWEMCV